MEGRRIKRMGGGGGVEGRRGVWREGGGGVEGRSGVWREGGEEGIEEKERMIEGGLE